MSVRKGAKVQRNAKQPEQALEDPFAASRAITSDEDRDLASASDVESRVRSTVETVGLIVIGVLVVFLCIAVGVECLSAAPVGGQRHSLLPEWVFEIIAHVIGPAMFLLAGATAIITLIFAVRFSRR